MDNIEKQPIDVLVIGAGISGLTSAYKLQEKAKSLNIVVVEADNRIGGQLNSTEHGELGARYITKNQYHIYKLLMEFNIELKKLKPNPCLMTNIIKNDFNNNEYMIKSHLINIEVQLILKRIEIECTKFSPGRFKILENDKTVGKFISQNLIFDNSKKIIKIFVKLICGTDPDNIKLSEFLSICNSAGGFHNLINLYTKSGSPTDTLFEFSSKQLLQTFEQKLKYVQILKNTSIVDIFHYPDHVIVRDENGNVFHSSMLIIAVPWNCVQKINIYPPIPNELRTSVSDIAFFITSFIAEYRLTQPWKSVNFCGTFINLEKPTLIAYEYSVTKFAGIVLHSHNGFESISKQSILEILGQKFGQSMMSPDTFIYKTYEQNLLLNLPTTTPWNRIIFSSTTSGTSYRGCLSGAVQSGYRAAVNTLLTIRPQNVHWQDLDEIQKARPLIRPISWWKSLVIEFNLMHYSAISIGMVIFLITYLKIKS